jgi:hypothetical protein
MKKMEKEYQAASDCDTLMRAHEIKSDKGRHKAAIAHAKGKMAGMAKVADKDNDKV